MSTLARTASTLGFLMATNVTLVALREPCLIL
jgi:hypothetical protein